MQIIVGLSFRVLSGRSVIFAVAEALDKVPLSQAKRVCPLLLGHHPGCHLVRQMTLPPCFVCSEILPTFIHYVLMTLKTEGFRVYLSQLFLNF